MMRGIWERLAQTDGPRGEQANTASEPLAVRPCRGLRESDVFDFGVLDSLADSVAVVDQEGVIVAVNRAWREFAVNNGAPALAEASIGTNYLAVCRQAGDHPLGEEATPVEAGIRAVLSGERPDFSHEYPCHSPAEKRWFQVTVTPLHGSRGAVVTHHDITRRRMAQEVSSRREEEFHTLAEALPQMVWATRPDGWNTYFNQQWVDYTGLTMEQSHGHGWIVPFHPDDRGRAWDAWREATETGGVYSLECRLRRADGVYLWWLIRGVPVHDGAGKVTKWVGACTSIDELRTALERASEAQRAKDAFLSRMSHELRTPLNAILGLAQVLHMGAEARSAGENRRHLQTVLDAGWQLLRIIEDILDLSAIETRTVDLKVGSIDLGACLADCFELIAALARERGLEFRWMDDAWRGVLIRGDSLRIRQVVTNLLTNAVKYNREGGRITVRGEQTEGGLRILVSDTGPGIPERRLASIFEPFEGLAQRSPGVSGAGIGLCVARRLTELMGGTIGVESVPGQGSTFWIELPRVGDSAHENAAGVEPVAPGISVARPGRQKAPQSLSSSAVNIIRNES
jgi:PAS domain S-box-containing protein